MKRYYGTVIAKRTRPNDELKHWKYIKKTKVNGKWRYTYDKEKLKDDIDMGLEERKQLMDAKDNADFYKAVYELTQERRNNPTAMDMKNFDGDVEKFKSEMDKQVDGTRANVVKAEKKVAECLKEYGNTPLGKLEKFINDGKDTISYLLKTVPKKFRLTKIGKGN